MDITPLFIERARADAQRAGVKVDYRLGSLRQLPVDGPFDAVVCWFTSFGYFDDAGNREVLSEFARVLRPGGHLLIETLNRDGFIRNLTPSPDTTTTVVGDDTMVDCTTFDPLSGRAVTERTITRDGATRRSEYSVRLPSAFAHL